MKQAADCRLQATGELANHFSSIPTLCEQNQLVIGNALNFVGHRLCK